MFEVQVANHGAPASAKINSSALIGPFNKNFLILSRQQVECVIAEKQTLALRRCPNSGGGTHPAHHSSQENRLEDACQI